MAQFLDPDYFLHKENQEWYAHEIAHEQLLFLNMFGTHQNKTGTFVSIDTSLSAAKALADEIMSEPTRYAEGIDFTSIKFTDNTPEAGVLGGRGFQFEYSDHWERNGMMSSTYPNRVTQCISALCIYTDTLINTVLTQKAGTDAPETSDWSSADADPKSDINKIQKEFYSTNQKLQATDIILANNQYFELCDYLDSFDIQYNILNLQWKGITFWNSGSVMPDGEYTALCNKVPAVVLEKYTNPKFSTIQQAIDTAVAVGDKKALTKLPDALVNTNKYKPEGKPEMNVQQFWFNMVPNVVNKQSIMHGIFGE
jgi:hypothetical protein